MAKWGEGDPRWIVEERPDATNVNNWHWTEKNACGWSQEKLKDLLMGLSIHSTTDVGTVILTDMDKLEGEAVVNNRKGKLIFFYEWDITMGWKGRLNNGSKTEIEGKMHIPNLSEENDVEEIDVSFTTKEKGAEAEILKQFLYVEGRDTVREKLRNYITLLKEEFSKGMILPKKDDDDNSKTNKDQISNLSSGFNKKMQMNSTNNSSDASGDKSLKSSDTTTLVSSHNFQCTGEEIYKALTDSQMMSAFTNGQAKVDAKKNGKFELFGGNVHGEFIDLVPSTKIVQRWRSKQWPSNHYSTVTIMIDQQQDHTVVRLKQTDVPHSEADGTRDNWDRFYWESIKRTFGWGTYFM